MSEDNNTVVTLKVRVTPEFREKIVETAKRNNRSMNQEIVSRLEESFTDKQNSYLNNEMLEQVLTTYTQRIFSALKNQGVSRELMENTVNEMKHKKAP